MIVYLFPIFFLFLFGIIELIVPKERTKICIIFAPLTFFYLWFFSGFRFEVGTDFFNYKMLFEHAEDFEHYEYIFLNLVKFFSYHFDFEYLLVFIAFVAVSLKLLMFRLYTKVFFIPCAIYFCTFFISWEMGAMRIGLAVAIALLSLPFLIQRKFLLYSLVITLAVLIHKATIVFLPLYFILTKSFKMKHIIVFFTLLIPLVVFGVIEMIVDFIISVVTGGGQWGYKIRKYLTNQEGVSLHFTAVAKKVILVSLFIFVRYFVIDIKKSPYFIPFFNMYLISTVIYFTLITNSPEMAVRTAAVIGLSEVFLLTFTVLALKKHLRWLAFLLVFLSSIGRFIVTTNQWSELYFPYSNILFKG